MPSRCLLVLALAAAGASAQLAPGDIGVTWLSPSSFSILRAAGGSAVINVGSFQGTGNTATILLDPQVPDAFLIGGSGFVGRAVITGAASANYTPVTNAVSLPAQMSWDGAALVVMDYGTDQVLSLDPGSGAVTNLTTGPQPWGTELNAGVLDPYSGRIYAGGLNGIWMIPPGSAAPVPYANGWVPMGGSSYVSGIVIDPVTFEPVATLLGVNRVVRVTAGGTLVNLVNPGAIPGPNAIDVDANGDFVVGASFGQIYRVPRAGGAPVLLGTAAGVVGAATGVASAQGIFRAFLTPGGAGAATLAISGVPAGTIEGWTFPTLDTALPPGAGPVFGVSPDALTWFVLGTYPAAQPGFIFHWTWPAGPGLFPAAAFALPPGALPAGLVLDLIGLAVGPGFALTPTPARRVVIA